ncbi:M50 family metallopeptidase [Elusimicrobiota bacterium]
MKCPKCGYENTDDALYCNLCQEIFKKEKKKEEEQSISAVGINKAAAAHPDMFSDTRLWCLAALILSVFITEKLRIIWYPFAFVKTFFHEIGHTVLYWVFGHFAIPAVNPLDTGGVAISLSYAKGFPVFVLIIMAAVIVIYRKYKHALETGIFVMVCYGLLAYTPAKDWLISAAGILAEYTAAGICLYVCLFRRTIKLKAERLMYGLLGWHMLISRVQFLIRLRTDDLFYKRYVDRTGWQRGMIGDLAAIAFDINHRFTVDSFNTIVGIFILFAFVPVVILAIIYYRKKHSRELFKYTQKNVE